LSGAFGEVLLVQDKSDPTILLAVKCIDLNNMQPGQVEQVRREVILLFFQLLTTKFLGPSSKNGVEP
jgi:hypothetical protein